jgi:hypothetical protein
MTQAPRETRLFTASIQLSIKLMHSLGSMADIVLGVQVVTDLEAHCGDDDLLHGCT